MIKPMFLRPFPHRSWSQWFKNRAYVRRMKLRGHNTLVIDGFSEMAERATRPDIEVFNAQYSDAIFTMFKDLNR